MLIVVRHGRTPANARRELLGRRDPSLDDRGRVEAAAIAAAVGPVDRVISSPLARCRETAAAMGSAVEVEDRLVEMDYGQLEGTPVADVPAEEWARWRSDNDYAPPDGESHNDLSARVGELLDELASDASASNIALVSHVSPIKAAVAWALGVPIDIAWRCFVAQASISRVSTDGDKPSLRSFNEVAHLDGLG